MGPAGARLFDRVVSVYVLLAWGVLVADVVPGRGWVSDLAAAAVASGGVLLARRLRSGRFAAGVFAAMAADRLAGDVAWSALRHGGNPGKVAAWLLPPAAAGLVLAFRWWRTVRVCRRDQLAAARSTDCPGSWPVSR